MTFEGILRFKDKRKGEGRIIQLTIRADQQIFTAHQQTVSINKFMYIHSFQEVDFLEVWKLEGSIHLSRVR